MDNNLSPILKDSCTKSKDKIAVGQIDFYRNLARHYMEKIEYTNAVYWQNKVVTFTSGDQQDVYHLAKFLFLDGQYLRAAHCIRFWHYEKDYNKALSSLDFNHKSGLHYCQKGAKSQWEPSDPRKTVMGDIHLIRGKIYAALMNRSKAIENYRKCLEYDIYCQEAFQLLSQYQMKSPDEIQQLMKELPFSQSCVIGDGVFVQQLYTCGEQSKAEEIHCDPTLAALKENVDVLIAKAEKYLTNGFTRKAHKIATKVHAIDPFHPAGLSVLVACQVELKMGIDLFKTSHKLVEVMPSTALAWYSVGAYYYDRGRQELARANLNKALSIDPVYGPAWLLFGHSFAKDKEHDQAMAVYFKASQLMKGCHLPLLYGGVECALTKNTDMALEFIKDASKLAPNDPFIHHEIGVIFFHDGEYQSAYKHLRKAERLLAKYDEEDKIYMDHWEPLYNNLGHCCRKLNNFLDSVKYHRKALSLRPNNFQSYSAIGFLFALNGNYEKASDYFHKALSLNRDDAFSNSMLRSVMDMFAENLDDSLDFLEEEDSFSFPRGNKSFNNNSEQSDSTVRDQPSSNNNSEAGTLDGSFGDVAANSNCEILLSEKSVPIQLGNYQFHSPLMKMSSAFTVESDSVGDK